MSPISILLMMIVDTVAQVAVKGQWRPYFDISGLRVELYFRPTGLDYSKPTNTLPRTKTSFARIAPPDFLVDDADEQEQLASLQEMLAFARSHLDTAPEA